MSQKRKIRVCSYLFLGTILFIQSSFINDPKFDKQNTKLPVLTTKSVSQITLISATCGGIITNYGNGIMTAYGVCWSTNKLPTIANRKSLNTQFFMDFNSSCTGLSPNTTYYVRAFATNQFGTGYGNILSFTTPRKTPNVTDIDGNLYPTVTIGSQIWMAKNLMTTRYRDGTNIQYISDSASWNNLKTGAGCNFSVGYGFLYNYYAVTDTHCICPKGWHVPSDSDWYSLTSYLGGDAVAGAKLKETGISHWNPNLEATNETRFTAIPGGYRSSIGSYGYLGYYGYWWTSTKSDSSNAWFRHIAFNYGNVTRDFVDKRNGFSVRCLKQ